MGFVLLRMNSYLRVFDCAHAYAKHDRIFTVRIIIARRILPLDIRKVKVLSTLIINYNYNYEPVIFFSVQKEIY